MSLSVSLEEAKLHRLEAERSFYLDPDNFIDYLRDSGAAPNAEDQPHGAGARWIMDWKIRPGTEDSLVPLYLYKMLLWPRGSFKSHCFDVGLTTWLIAKDPNVRILVASETNKQAKEFVSLSMEIIGSPWFKRLFGDHTRNKWYMGKSFKSSERTLPLKEATLLATGVDQVQTGMHWDWVICDDIVSQESTRTAEGVEATKKWLGETLAQLDPGKKLLMIGTRHHYADIYGWYMKDEIRRQKWDISIHKWKRDDGSLFFPQRLTEDYVLGQKAVMPMAQWGAYYNNDPATEDEKMFLPEYFHVIKDEDVPAATWSYILTDFAYTGEKVASSSDRTCFWVVSVDPNRVWYVRDFFVKRVKPSDSVGKCIQLWNRWYDYNLKGISIEKTTQKGLIAACFEEIRRDTFVQPTLISIEGRSKTVKEERIKGLEPIFRRGEIYFCQSVRNDPAKWNPMIDEMTEFPFSQHDDIPDALGDISQKDNKGRYFIKHPPKDFNPQVRTYLEVPSVIDGMLNPRAQVEPAQKGGQTIWNQQSGPTHPVNGDLFQKRVRRP